MQEAAEKLIVAIDVETYEEAVRLVDSLSPDVRIFKIGSQIFTACGPKIIEHILDAGGEVFLDLKFHDIPNTVGNAVASAVGLSNGRDKGVHMCTVHTMGGQEMLEAAVAKATKTAEMIKVKRPLIIGITVLTSDAKTDNMKSIVLERARLAKTSGLDGVVASSQEAGILRREFGKSFLIVTPGIRPEGSEAGDQKRVTTPFDAISNGSNYLVVGRPIVKADDPHKAAKNILKEIQNALSV